MREFCVVSIQLTNFLNSELSHSVQHNDSSEVSFVKYRIYVIM
jgi:hypothetical protein